MKLRTFLAVLAKWEFQECTQNQWRIQLQRCSTFSPTLIGYFSKVLLIPTFLPLDLQRFKLFRAWTEPQNVNMRINDITMIFSVWRAQADSSNVWQNQSSWNHFHRADGFILCRVSKFNLQDPVGLQDQQDQRTTARERGREGERERWHSSCGAFQCDGPCAFRGMQLAF